jgi:putative ATPase
MQQRPDIPLAERMRPGSLDKYTGQAHLVGENAPLRKAIRSGQVPSFILWGPPGVGKTTLAHIISKEIEVPFYTLSAVSSGVKEVREVIERAANQGLFARGRPILFIDEIHRFSKSQQDSLLSAVEKGVITLIGATTENPSFEVIPALLSRCQVFVMKSFGEGDMQDLLDRALREDDWLRSTGVKLQEYQALMRISGGDARKLLNALEIVISFSGEPGTPITDELVMNAVQQNISLYDKSGEMHYDIISAFIKSIRGSDPDAAVYYLARMVEGGEDPKFIARRLLILAAEDIGLANPSALALADATFSAVEKIGWPESRIILSQCAIYLATSDKSNSAYAAIETAISEVRKSGNLSVPIHLRNAPTKLMKDLGYGQEYRYSHAFEGNFVQQEYLPSELTGSVFYEPGKNGREQAIGEWLRKKWKGAEHNEKKAGE